MAVLPQSVQKVISEFERLPGVGSKSAARMAYHYIRSRGGDSENLAKALLEMSAKVRNCTKCFNVAESDVCDICDSPLRDKGRLCVVEEPLDVVAFENSSVYDGFYFVLGGVISPAEGVGAEELRFKELYMRVKGLIEDIRNSGGGNSEDTMGKDGEKGGSKSEDSYVVEIIVATNPSLEGEATAMYIQDLFKKMTAAGDVKVTRLAMGLPTGADLEYADRLTLKRALEGRRGL